MSLIASSAGIVAARVANAASDNIPVVFVMGGDPVKFGLVTSLNRPGGHATGVSFLLNVLAAKRVALLRELVPTAATVGLLVNPDNPNAEADVDAAQEAARALGQQAYVVMPGPQATLMQHSQALSSSVPQRCSWHPMFCS